MPDYNKFDISKTTNNIKRVMLTLPLIVGKDIVKFTMERFRQRNWIDNSTEIWTKRSAKSKRDNGRALLIDTGTLRRSIRVISSDENSVTVGSSTLYGQIHNDGFNNWQSVKAHKRKKYLVFKAKATSLKTKKTRKVTSKLHTGDIEVAAHRRFMRMPRRRFLGNSQFMKQQISRSIAAEIKKAFV